MTRQDTAPNDDSWMGVAVEAAAAVRRSVTPRPWVGAVVVSEGGAHHVGATEGRTGRHAEVVALAAAGPSASGSTLYCTLEPCSHTGATPPCVEAVLAAGVSRVVLGIEDPDPRVAGSGIERLRQAGIEVVVGVRAEEVADQLEPYLVHRRTGRPYVVLKVATTLDGRAAAPDGSSRWITGPEARLDAHRLRADSDAVAVGAGTVRADDPALTVRLPPGEAEGIEPLRVVFGRAPHGARVLPAREVTGDLGEILGDLGRSGVVQLLVEGGPTLAAELHRAGLVDRYVFYLAPALMGGDDGVAALQGAGSTTMAEVWRGAFRSVHRLGPDIRVDLTPSGAAEGG